MIICPDDCLDLPTELFFCFVFHSAGQDVLNGAGLKRIGQGFAELQNKNEQISRNPQRVAHCRVSSLVLVCRRSFAAKANLLAIETALLTRRQQSADHNRYKVCQVGVTVR